jgi:starch synthase
LKIEDMVKKKILYVAPEIFPYLEESYISNLCRYLPQGIQENGNEIRTFMPKYGCINERKNLLHEVIRLSGQNIIIEDTDHPLIIKVASLQSVRMQIYFIDSEDFFKRKQRVYSEENLFFPDNDSRAIFFAKGVIETVRKLGWNPDIIHCHGWISALVPIFIKTCYKDNPLFQDARLVYSIYNDDFPEKFSATFGKKLAITGIPKAHITHMRSPGFDALMKTAIDFSDATVIAHPQIRKTLKTYLNSCPNEVFAHPDTENYVEEYDALYERLIAKDPILF